MSRPDDFDRQQNDPGTDPRWYRVSYSGEEGGNPYQVPLDPPVGRPRAKRLLVIAGLVLLIVALLAVAGFGGAMIARYLEGLDDGNTVNTVTAGEGGYTGTYFEESGGASYNYVEAVLQKNDGTELVGSQNGSAGDAASSKIAVVAAVKDSVVEIMTTVSSNRGTIRAGAGSGVIIHADGIIVTNHHVVSGSTDIFVRLTNGNTYKAYLRGVDEDGDIAVLKITPQETLTVARLGYSGAAAVGEEVLAIGNPLGQLGGTVTDGIISAVSREVAVGGVTMTLLQTNAAINSGNSGGALFNMAGELIGVVNAKYAAEGVEGLGFAIPIDTAYISIRQLLDHGYIPGVPSLGVTLEVGKLQTGFMQYRTVVYVYDPLESPVLEELDYILEIDGVAVASLDAVKAIVCEHRVGDVLTLTIKRDSVEKTVQVTLVEYVP